MAERTGGQQGRMTSGASGGCRAGRPHSPLDTFGFHVEWNGETQQGPDLTVSQVHSAHWVEKSTGGRGKQGDQVGNYCNDAGEKWWWCRAGGDGDQTLDPLLMGEEITGFAGELGVRYEETEDCEALGPINFRMEFLFTVQERWNLRCAVLERQWPGDWREDRWVDGQATRDWVL